MNVQEQLEIADQHLEQGDFSAAINSYNEIIGVEPECDEAWLMLGSIYGETGEVEKAVTHLEKAITIKPDDSYPYLILGQINNSTGKTEEAKENFIKATECDTENTEALCMLASFCQQQGDINEAITLYEKAAVLDDSDVSIWEMLAPLHFHNNNLARAEECYRKAISLRPAEPTAFLGLCSLLTHTSRSEEALKLLNVLPDDAKSHPDILFQFSLASSREGLHEEALEYINKAIELDSNDNFILGKIEILQIKSDYEEAFDLLKPYVEGDDPNIKAVIVLAKFCKQIDLVDECIRLLDRVLKNTDLTPYEKYEAQRVRNLLTDS